MKKILAVMLSVIMLFSLSTVLFASAAEEVKDLDSYAPVNMSFDTIYYNGYYGGPVNVYVDAGGGGGPKLDETARAFDNQGFAIKNIGLRGWIGFDKPISRFGYFANDQLIFGNFAEAFMAEADETNIKAAGGENAVRYNIDIPVASFGGDVTFTACAQLSDGTVVKFVSSETTKNTTFTCKNGEVSEVKNSDAIMYNDYTGKKAMSYDTVTWNNTQLNDPSQVTSVESPEFAYNKIRTFLNDDGVIDQVAYGGNTMRFWGWAALDQAIEAFGYAIDKDVYFDGLSYPDANFEQGIVNHLVSNIGFDEDTAKLSRRYTVVVPFRNYTGTHDIGVAVKLADGTILILNDTVISVRGAEEVQPQTDEPQPQTDEPQPQTGDAAVAMIAVAAVLAMSAAVVFAKKRSF